MRRFIVPLSLLAAAAAISVLVIVGPAAASSRAPHIICPQAQGPRIPPCCPLPARADVQPICCQSTPCCPGAATPCCTSTTCCPAGGCCTPTPCGSGSLTIASSPNPSLAGAKVVISGSFAGTPASGVQVVLWRERAGQSSFQQLAQTTTDSAGKYTFTLGRGTVMADQAWYVSSNGVQSATIDQHVGALVGLSAASRSAIAGRPVVLRGHVTPSHAGQTVLIERKHGAAWRVIARARLGQGSSYSVSHRFAHAGAAELRAQLRGDARNDTSASRTVTIEVKQ